MHPKEADVQVVNRTRVHQRLGQILGHCLSTGLYINTCTICKRTQMNKGTLPNILDETRFVNAGLVGTIGHGKLDGRQLH